MSHPEPTGAARNLPCRCGSGVKAKKCPRLLEQRTSERAAADRERVFWEEQAGSCPECGGRFDRYPDRDTCPRTDRHLRGVAVRERAERAEARIRGTLAVLGRIAGRHASPFGRYG